MSTAPDSLAEVESHCIETGTDPEEAFGDARLPAGVITGAVGAPVMLWLLVQQRRGARS